MIKNIHIASSDSERIEVKDVGKEAKGVIIFAIKINPIIKMLIIKMGKKTILLLNPSSQSYVC